MLLQMNDIVKQYPGVRALGGVSFSLQAGEVHGLVGENGAGKSTLMKILAGAILPDAGSVVVDDRAVRIHTPADAQRYGIGIIHQDAHQVPELSIGENIFLGNEPLQHGGPFIDKAKLHADAAALLHRLGESIPTFLALKDCTVAQKQIVEIAKALCRQVRILVFDEPTASLTDHETENLFRLIAELKATGVGIVYISHRLEEILRITNRITVLRDGVIVAVAPTNDVKLPQVIRWMVGREMNEEFPDTVRTSGEEIFRVEDLRTDRLRDISFALKKGEILGLAGLVGAGRTELARAIFGADPILGGKRFLHGKEIAPRSPQEAIQEGIGLLTEDRNGQGLFLLRDVKENISISSLRDFIRRGFLSIRREQERVGEYIESLRINPPQTAVTVDALSGGNRQKVILARWLATRSSLLIFDEPTVGIDVGVKYEIYVLMNELVKRGIGVIVISSDLNELIGISDRIAVLCSGRMTGILLRSEATMPRIMELATTFH